KYQAAREGVRGARAEEEVTREDVLSSVITQYLLVLRAFATFEAAKSRVALAERLYQQALHQQATGVGLSIDTTRAQVELQNERQNLIDAETLTHTTSYVLAELLNLSRDQEVQVADKLGFFDVPQYDRVAAVTTALTNRPEMRSIAAQQRIALLDRKA